MVREGDLHKNAKQSDAGLIKLELIEDRGNTSQSVALGMDFHSPPLKIRTSSKPLWINLGGSTTHSHCSPTWGTNSTNFYPTVQFYCIQYCIKISRDPLCIKPEFKLDPQIYRAHFVALFWNVDSAADSTTLAWPNPFVIFVLWFSKWIWPAWEGAENAFYWNCLSISSIRAIRNYHKITKNIAGETVIFLEDFPVRNLWDQNRVALNAVWIRRGRPCKLEIYLLNCNFLSSLLSSEILLQRSQQQNI